MTRQAAIEEAKRKLESSGMTQLVLRRGKNYKVSYDLIVGWKIAEMIGKGNVQNY